MNERSLAKIVSSNHMIPTLVVLVATSYAATACKTQETAKQTEEPKPAASSLLRVYEVDRQVSDFTEGEDFSTPEAAYATINRMRAEGMPGGWGQVSVRRNRESQPPEDTKPRTVSPEFAEAMLALRVLEVQVVGEKYAAVLGEVPWPPGESRFDGRSLEREGNRWVNSGHTSRDTIEELREKVLRLISQWERRFVDFAGKQPSEYLSTFVEFLKSESEEPKAFVLRQLENHKVTILGEIHHRPDYWAFNASLVKDPAFAEWVGVVFLELSSDEQLLIDEFLAADEMDTTLVIKVLRDILHLGWPDQAMLDFFVTVWRVNQDLPQHKRIRIVAADLPRPWEETLEPADLKKWETDRDRLMAETILSDLEHHAQDKRNALFIVGVGHSLLDQTTVAGEPIKHAGWHLCQRLGREAICAIFPHTAVMTNIGQVYGRLRQGLFESAFEAVGNRPMAFPLDKGPFGKEPYDAFPDSRADGTYADGFDAYLYLGPLEHELFSPLIAGFYDDEFVQEVDRRYRLVSGKSWSERYGRDLCAENLIAWMRGSWGKPRWKSEELGPISVWSESSAK